MYIQQNKLSKQTFVNKKNYVLAWNFDMNDNKVFKISASEINCTSLLHIFDTWFFPLLRLERALVSSFQALKIDGSSGGLFNQVQYTLHEPALQPAMWSS